MTTTSKSYVGYTDKTPAPGWVEWFRTQITSEPDKNDRYIYDYVETIKGEYAFICRADMNGIWMDAIPVPLEKDINNFKWEYTSTIMNYLPNQKLTNILGIVNMLFESGLLKEPIKLFQEG